jgi:hypothetical protein
VGEKAIVVLGKCEHLARIGSLVRNRFEFNKPLTNEVFHVGFHTIVVTAIGKFRFFGEGTEPGSHGERLELQLHKQCCPATCPYHKPCDAEPRTGRPGVALFAGVGGESSPYLLGNIELGKSKNHFFTLE